MICLLSARRGGVGESEAAHILYLSVCSEVCIGSISGWRSVQQACVHVPEDRGSSKVKFPIVECDALHFQLIKCRLGDRLLWVVGVPAEMWSAIRFTVSATVAPHL